MKIELFGDKIDFFSPLKSHKHVHTFISKKSEVKKKHRDTKH